MELQVPLVDRNLALAWKQALRAFGVHSPRRPEFREMVEAAFRPAFSFHSLALASLLLHRLGLIAEPQELARLLSTVHPLDRQRQPFLDQRSRLLPQISQARMYCRAVLIVVVGALLWLFAGEASQIASHGLDELLSHVGADVVDAADPDVSRPMITGPASSGTLPQAISAA